jgi:hypothetical protein
VAAATTSAALTQFEQASVAMTGTPVVIAA